jgi:hypothetical protein
MRDRLLTPFIPVFCGASSTDPGVESPRPGRSLEGRVVDNGRYLLGRKTGHSRTTLRFVAHDLNAGIELDLHVHPDPEAREGFRVGRTTIPEPDDLPDLLRPAPAQSPASDADAGASAALRRFWSELRSIFGAGR